MPFDWQSYWQFVGVLFMLWRIAEGLYDIREIHETSLKKESLNDHK